MARRTKSAKSGIRIENLGAVTRALRQLPGDISDELKTASGEIATRVASQARMPAGARRQSARAAETLRVRKGTTPSIALGSAAVPFALGAEFGGGRRPTTQQFPPWRGSGKTAGYFLYPTVRTLEKWIGETYLEALDDALATAERRGN